MRGHALRGIGARDAGTQASAAKPKAMRIGVIMIAGNASRPSAMKKNEVPQMRPGVARRAQSAVVGCVVELTRRIYVHTLRVLGVKRLGMRVTAHRESS